MRAKVVIESEDDFKTWLATQQTFAQSRRGEAAHDRRASAR
jgi:heme/copper-type cytochrome/quinol oxidase subunit 2